MTSQILITSMVVIKPNSKAKVESSTMVVLRPNVKSTIDIDYDSAFHSLISIQDLNYGDPIMVRFERSFPLLN